MNGHRFRVCHLSISAISALMSLSAPVPMLSSSMDLKNMRWMSLSRIATVFLLWNNSQYQQCDYDASEPAFKAFNLGAFHECFSSHSAIAAMKQSAVTRQCCASVSFISSETRYDHDFSKRNQSLNSSFKSGRLSP